MIETFHDRNFHRLCDDLATRDPDLKGIIKRYGYPPLWSRTPSFETLVQIILEQQVSLASAKAAITRLKERVRRVTPKNLLQLTDAELRDCYFSRQKTIYVRELARAVDSRRLRLGPLNGIDDHSIREQLKQIKGIGDWTADVYLLMAMHRTDVFPLGDLAMVNSLKEIKKLPPGATKSELLRLARVWQPFRSIATMLLWHHYLSRRQKQVVLNQP